MKIISDIFKSKNGRRVLAVSGFTMVELLVVVAIIGLLASLTLTRFNSVQKKSRDTRRAVDVDTFMKALNLYNNNFAAYPVYTGYITGSDPVSTDLKNSGLLKSIPLDPTNRELDGIIYKYGYSSDGADFQLQYCMETNLLLNTEQGCENYANP